MRKQQQEQQLKKMLFHQQFFDYKFVIIESRLQTSTAQGVMQLLGACSSFIAVYAYIRLAVQESTQDDRQASKQGGQASWRNLTAQQRNSTPEHAH